MRKTALITGASHGIGCALAHEFASHKYDLILVSRHEERLLETVSTIKTRHGVYGIQVVPIVKDLTKPRACEELYEEIRSLHLEVDVLVNDAGMGKQGTFVEAPIEDTIETIVLNTIALSLLIRLFMKDMLAKNAGHILNVGSIYGYQPIPLMAAYHASKAYVNTLSEALVDELKDTNVIVSCLCPGPIDAQFLEETSVVQQEIQNKEILTSPEEIAEIAYRGLMNKERVIVPGIMNKVVTFTRRLIPIDLQEKMGKKLFEQGTE